MGGSIDVGSNAHVGLIAVYRRSSCLSAHVLLRNRSHGLDAKNLASPVGPGTSRGLRLIAGV